MYSRSHHHRCNDCGVHTLHRQVDWENALYLTYQKFTSQASFLRRLLFRIEQRCNWYWHLVSEEDYVLLTFMQQTVPLTCEKCGNILLLRKYSREEILPDVSSSVLYRMLIRKNYGW